MVDNSVVKINNKEYLVLDVIPYKDFNFVYLANELIEDDMLIQKEIIENDTKYLVNLDSKEEFIKALNLFEEKNK